MGLFKKKPSKGRALVPGETVYAVATGAVNPFSRSSRKAMDFMAEREGFVGAHPMFERSACLWFYATENDAKIARNEAECMGITCGRNISRFNVGADGVPEFDETQIGDGR